MRELGEGPAAEALIAEADRLLDAWPDAVRAYYVGPQCFTAAGAVACWTRVLRQLTFWQPDDSARLSVQPELEQLMASSHLSNLRAIVINKNANINLVTITQSPYVTALRELAYSGEGLRMSPEHWLQCVGSPNFARLTSLRASASGVAATASVELACRNAAQLESLKLSYLYGGTAPLQAALASFVRLRFLGLNDCSLFDADLERIAAAVPPRLRELDLAGNHFSDRAWASFLACAQLAHVRIVRVAPDRARPEGARGAPHPGARAVPTTHLGPDLPPAVAVGLRAIPCAQNFAALVDSLIVHKDDADAARWLPQVAVALARWPDDARAAHVSSGCFLQDGQVAPWTQFVWQLGFYLEGDAPEHRLDREFSVLMASPYLRKLYSLAIGPGAVQKLQPLVRSPYVTDLRGLIISGGGTRMQPEDWDEFVDAANLEHLTMLVRSGDGLATDAMQRLAIKRRKTLQSLFFTDIKTRPEALLAALTSSVFADLRLLHLDRCQLCDDDVLSLIESGLGSHLKLLHVRGNAISPKTVAVARTRLADQGSARLVV